MYRLILNRSRFGLPARSFHRNFKDKLISQNTKIGLLSDTEEVILSIDKLKDKYEKRIASYEKKFEILRIKDYYQNSTIEILLLKVDRLNRKIDSLTKK